MKKQLLAIPLGMALLCASEINAQNWLLGGQNVSAAGGILGSNNNRPIIFETNNTERGRIQNSSGFWGFGKNAPAAQVHINAVAAGTNPLQVDILNSAVMVVTSAGNTGLGTISPFARLHVNGAPEEDPFVVQTDGTTRLLASSNGGVSIGTDAIPPSNGLHILGNTGIGIPTPSVKLHVSGGSDASPAGGGFIVNGSVSGLNLVIDDNEIMARNNGAVSGLTLNNNGGNVVIDGTKSGSRLALGTANPEVDLHIVHGLGSGITDGLRLKNEGTNNEDWTFYVQNGNGILEFSANNVLMGTFDDVSGNYSSVSDIRRKKNIESSPDLIDKVLQLGVKKYHFLENKSTDKKYYGLIAQEVEKIFPEVVSHHRADAGDEYYTIDYSSFGVLAIKAIQEQQKQIDLQKKELEDLKRSIAELKATVTGSSADNMTATGKDVTGASLEQNQPNPFSQTATIRYSIPNAAKGQINIYDAAGKPVKVLQAAGSGQVQLNAGDLKAGVYTYTLSVNGRTTGSKKMVVAK